MTPQPNTRIDGPYTSGVLSLHRKLTHFHNGGWEYQAGDNPLTCKPAQIPPSRLVEDEWRVTPDAPNPPAKPNTQPPALDPPEPSGVYLANHFGSLTDVYRLGREHGRQEVAKRLPSPLYGFWWAGGWTNVFGTSKKFISEQCGEHKDSPRVREFDPMTGGPKG